MNRLCKVWRKKKKGEEEGKKIQVDGGRKKKVWLSMGTDPNEKE